MKILLAVPDTNLGGITTSAINFTNEMTRHGDEIYFLDMSGENQCAQKLSKGVQIVSLKGKSKLWNLGSQTVAKARGIKKIFLLLLGLVKKITIKSGFWYKLIFSPFKEYGEFDVALAFRQCDPCYSFILQKVNAKKKIGFVHGELKYMGDISSWKRHMEKFNKIAYVSEAVRDEFVSEYPELKKNACAVYNMFDTEQIKKSAEEEPSCEFDKDKINIVTVARIDNEFKQINWIVDVCDKLKKENLPTFHWYIAGDGPDYYEILEYAKEKRVTDVLTFLGRQENPHALVKQCDFTVLTSKSEAYPMVVNESFVLGKPMVSTKFGSVYELIKDGTDGLIAEQSVESLVKKISAMIEDKDNIRTNCTQILSERKATNDVCVSQFLSALECE